jgi:hypothetical protein
MIFQCKIANFISSLENGEWAEKNVNRVRYTLPLYMTLPTCCASATTDLSRIGMPGKIGSGWMRDPFARLEITAWRRRTCYCFFFLPLCRSASLYLRIPCCQVSSYEPSVFDQDTFGDLVVHWVMITSYMCNEVFKKILIYVNLRCLRIAMHQPSRTGFMHLTFSNCHASASTKYRSSRLLLMTGPDPIIGGRSMKKKKRPVRKRVCQTPNDAHSCLLDSLSHVGSYHFLFYR